MELTTEGSKQNEILCMTINGEGEWEVDILNNEVSERSGINFTRGEIPKVANCDSHQIASQQKQHVNSIWRYILKEKNKNTSGWTI